MSCIASINLCISAYDKRRYKCVVHGNGVRRAHQIQGLEVGRIKGIGRRVRPFKPVTHAADIVDDLGGRTP